MQFPLPNEIYDDLGFDACPIFDTEHASVSIGEPATAPMIFHTDPMRWSSTSPSAWASTR